MQGSKVVESENIYVHVW